MDQLQNRTSGYVDCYEVEVSATPCEAFGPIQRIGGSAGWYFADWLWTIRGTIDETLGGVGVSRGRRHPTELAVGDTVDGWRVEAYEPGRYLRLIAEMRLPGEARLDYVVEPQPAGSTIQQIVRFEPKGLLGRAYWWTVYPLHRWVFEGMLNGIAQKVNLPDIKDGRGFQLFALFCFLGICLGTAGLGALLTNTSVDGWYRTIEKPTWNPPNWVFGPVWTFLYCCMAVAGWLVWRRRHQLEVTAALILFLLQLVLNLAWSALFFGLQSPLSAALEILVLWIAIALTCRSFFQIQPLAGWLFVPYLAWVSFAGVLNWTIWTLNT